MSEPRFPCDCGREELVLYRGASGKPILLATTPDTAGIGVRLGEQQLDRLINELQNAREWSVGLAKEEER